MLRWIIAIGVLQLAAATNAEPGHDHGGQAAHVHGEARLDIVLVEGVLQIELTSPAVNVFGFEHAPRSEAERQQVSRAMELLGNAEDLFQLRGGRCALDSVNSGIPAPLRDNGREEHEGQTHHEEGSGGAGHSRESSQDKVVHGDLVMQYRFRCESAKLSAIRLGLFDLFPGFDKVKVRWVIEASQSSDILSRSHNHLQF